jgi:translocation and assembly module TamB
MQVSGSADAPIVQFTSSPPLSSEQIVLLVTAGTIPAQERLSTTDRAGTVALFLGRDLLSKLGFRDEDESRLDIHSGQDISEQGRPTYNVEYKLSERWSLVGEYDRFGAYNAGFKWRIYSK